MGYPSSILDYPTRTGSEDTVEKEHRAHRARRDEMSRDVVRIIETNDAQQEAYLNLLRWVHELQLAKRLDDPDGWDTAEKEHRAVEDSIVELLRVLRLEAQEWRRVWPNEYAEAMGRSGVRGTGTPAAAE